MTRLLADLDAFYLEHRRCGELDLESGKDGARVILSCSCGAVLDNLPSYVERSH